MNIIPTHEIPSLPNELIIGWEKIQNFESTELPFINNHFLKQNPNFKRKNEHYTSRKLFGNLLFLLDLPTDSVELKKMDLGKPYATVGNKMLYTSFSNCEDWVLCGLSLRLDIGIDCEQLDRKINPKIFDRILDVSEKKIIDEQSYLAIWTMKEAVVKCIGIGIRSSLQNYPLIKKDDRYVVKSKNLNINVVPFIWENHQIAVAWDE